MLKTRLYEIKLRNREEATGRREAGAAGPMSWHDFRRPKFTALPTER
jgi:hypothetical protein